MERAHYTNTAPWEETKNLSNLKWKKIFKKELMVTSILKSRKSSYAILIFEQFFEHDSLTSKLIYHIDQLVHLFDKLISN